MDYRKITPGLSSMLLKLDQPAASNLVSSALTLGFIQPTESTNETSVVVNLRLRPGTNLEELSALGVRINNSRASGSDVKEEVRTAYLPLSALSSLSDHPSVIRISAGKYLEYRMDVAVPAVAIPAFKTRHPDANDGSRTIIGVVDSGIDAAHPAFAGRIVKVWDQTVPGPGIPGFGYGVEYVVGAGPVGSFDTVGHGTHVAGIAGGDDVTYQGVAHRADYVIVKTTMMNAQIADGVDYIFDYAQSQGRPAVVNLSLGGHFDPHDGTDDLSSRLAAASGPGRIVVCAAGNEGADDIHASTQVTAGTPSLLSFSIPSSFSNLAINGWYAGADVMEIAVRGPSGTATTFQPPITAGNPSVSYTLPDGIVQITTPGPDPSNGDHNFLIEVFGHVSTGGWSVEINGVSVTNGEVHAWMLDNAQTPATFVAPGLAPGYKIGSPGSCKDAITVAAYTTKVNWTDLSGASQSIPSLTLNDMAYFSSDGPLRDGANKPEVAAPGAVIGAALSSRSAPQPAFKLSANYRINLGTSMACPFITGLVALMLTEDEKVQPGVWRGPAQIRQDLINGSRIPGPPPGTFDPKWGFGLIDGNIL